MSEREIDELLETLYQRWLKLNAVSSWDTVDAELATMIAYLTACGKYERIAPSDRIRREQENAAWN